MTITTMTLDPALLKSMIATGAERLIASADELTSLDQAIGDGDHGVNMKRGCEQVLAELDAIAAKPTGEALKAVGMALVMKVGGASGPLYGSLFMGMGKKLGERPATMDLLAGSRLPLASRRSRRAANRRPGKRRCLTF